MNQSRAIFKESLKQVIWFTKQKLYEEMPKWAAFKCSASKLKNFLVLLHVFYALEFSPHS